MIEVTEEHRALAREGVELQYRFHTGCEPSDGGSGLTQFIEYIIEHIATNIAMQNVVARAVSSSELRLDFTPAHEHDFVVGELVSIKFLSDVRPIGTITYINEAGNKITTSRRFTAVRCGDKYMMGNCELIHGYHKKSHWQP